jgi:F-type H+-transporting ATPase subunit b
VSVRVQDAAILDTLQNRVLTCSFWRFFCFFLSVWQRAMGDIVSQLGRLFLESVPTVIFVFLLLFILDWLFFRPLTRILKEREDVTVGALARAREQARTASDKAREYEEAFQAARQDVYRQREAERKAALREREATLGQARWEAERLGREGQAALRQEVETVKGDLQAACRTLAQEITEVVLGLDPSAGKGGA